MLRDEHGMAAHWSLLTVVAWLRGRQPLSNKPACMLNDFRASFGVEVGAVSLIEMKPAAKCRSRKPLQRCVEVFLRVHACLKVKCRRIVDSHYARWGKILKPNMR